MALYNYRYAVGHNNTAGYVNIETVAPYPPTILDGGAVPALGRVVRRTLSGVTVRNGDREHAWVWDTLTQSELNAIVTALLGAHTTASRKLTISTITTAGVYDDFNVTVDLPIEGVDYERVSGGSLRAVRFTFHDISEV